MARVAQSLVGEAPNAPHAFEVVELAHASLPKRRPEGSFADA